MNDGSSNFSGLQKEWSLLVHSFLDQENTDHKLQTKLNPQDLSLEQMSLVKKDLSQQRQILNQKIEFVKNEIDRLTTIIENLALVGSSPEDIQTEIEDLHKQGEKYSDAIQRVELKIHRIHDLKDRMSKMPGFINDPL